MRGCHSAVVDGIEDDGMFVLVMSDIVNDETDLQ